MPTRSEAIVSPGAADELGPAVAMHGIVKRFDGVEALGGVDFELMPGEIHGLLGENGAGKTTLMNILHGLIAPDAGTISIRGKRVDLHSPLDAIEQGVGMVHQHFMLVPTLTVAENMILGEASGVSVNKRHVKAVEERIKEASERYGLDVDPRSHVWQLSVGQQQRVEIVRALYRNARILILDEPTATLTPLETEQLLPRLRALADEGASVVFITHHLAEVLEWTDRITVLRRGKRVATLRPDETTVRELARIMVGRDVALKSLGVDVSPAGEQRHVTRNEPAGAVLSVRGLEARGDMGTPALRGVEFAVRGGEIVAIVGVEGNGQAELEEVLFGLRPATAGSVLLDAQDVTSVSPRERLNRGLGIIPSDRYRRGLIRALSVAENLVFDRIGEEPFGKRTVRRKAIWTYALQLIERFSIRVSGPGQSAGTLSGGNAQRVVLARTMSRELRCLIAAQPTRGLDVGSTEFVWAQLDAARKTGVAILLISTDLDEVKAVSDRCFVMYRGQLVASWPRTDLDRDRIGLAMGGVVDSPDTNEGREGL
jgi:general nucleoside transport system ATP-binding protein